MNENIEVIETTEKTKGGQTFLPKSDSDLIELSKGVAEKMEEENITLKWISVSEFKAQIEAFSKVLFDIKNPNATGVPASHQLLNLNKTIDTSTELIKSYIVEKFGKKDSMNYYEEFGIVKGRLYKLPTDKEERKEAFDKLIAALNTYKMQDKAFGVDFWSKIKSEYSHLLELEAIPVVSLAEMTEIKNKSKDTIRKVLYSVIYLIKAHYPDTNKTVLQSWGFLREKE